MDTNGAYVDGVLVNLKSSRLKDKEEGGSLDNTLKTGENGSAGTIIYDYQSYLKDPEKAFYLYKKVLCKNNKSKEYLENIGIPISYGENVRKLIRKKDDNE